MELPSPEDVFSNALSSPQNFTHSEGNLTHSDENSTHRTQDRDEFGRFLSAHFDKPFVDQLDVLNPAFRQQLEELAQPAREKRRLSSEDMRGVIKALCAENYVAISVLSELVDRTTQNIRQSHLKSMIERQELKLAFPNKPNSPKQGYTVS